MCHGKGKQVLLQMQNTCNTSSEAFLNRKHRFLSSKPPIQKVGNASRNTPKHYRK